MSQAPLCGVRGIFSFWWMVFKQGFREAWAILDHLNNIVGILAALALIFTFVKLDMNYWTIVIPASAFALLVIYKVMIRGPYKVYMDLIQKNDADRIRLESKVDDLTQRIESVSKTRALLEIIPEIQPTVRSGHDLHFLLRVKNHGPATASKVKVRLESVMQTPGIIPVGRCLKRWNATEKENETVTDIYFSNDEIWGLLWTDYNSVRFHTVESLGLDRHDIDCELLIRATCENSNPKEIRLKFQWAGDNPPKVELGPAVEIQR